MADVTTKPVGLYPLATVAIDSRTIGIPDDNLCEGVPLWPWVGGVGFGIAKGASYPIINTNPTILLTRYSANVGADLAFGICGPAYAFDLTAQGTLEDVSDPALGAGQQLTLNLSDDSASAGFFVGDQLLVSLAFGAQIEVPTLKGNIWHLHFELEWESLFNVNIPLTFSILATLVEIIKVLLEASKDELEEEADPDLSSKIKDALGEGALGTISTFTMYAESQGDLSSTGETTVEPTLAFNINILPFIEGVGELDKGLQKVGIALAVGPTFQLGIPVDIKINEAYVNAEQFGENFSLENGTLTATRYGEPITEVDSVALGVQHTPGFDFLAGIFFQFTWLKFLNLSPSITFSVTGLLGLNITTGTQQHVVDDQGKIDPFSAASEVEIFFEDHHPEDHH